MKDIELFNDNWKDIPLYDGYYQASTNGLIRSCDRLIKQKGHKNNYVRKMRGTILKPKELNSGYLVVWLCKDGKTKAVSVHRLIAETFLTNTDKTKNEVNHKNGNKQDNRVENLEWCTRSYNILHSYNNPQRGKNSVKVLCKNTGVVYNSILEASIYCKMNYSTFKKRLNCDNVEISGYLWKKLN